ncbi:unnamed protein product [Parascedosporium putredinis]|uniref:RNA-dependent RNA polymerase n=1 Tax=Parascedosporium putredinis TaxID=1442378 RepID=A0A9P1GV16_9PEZI|nr:unnamed protein product [Parascedosporium putredinis]CAI7987902.1 unnamed protein product [Parascedosporium putredinis]
MSGFKVRSPTRPRVFYDRFIKLTPSSKTWLGVPEFEITLDLVRMELAAFFRTDSSPNRPGFYKLNMEFRHLDKVHWQRIDGSQSWAMVIPLKHPPHYFWKRESVEQTFAENSPTWTRSLIWHRATNIETVLDGQMFRQLSLQDSAEMTDPSFVNLGRWTAFGFLFHEVGRASQALDALQDFNVTIDSATKLKVAETSLPLWNLIHAEPATQLGMVKRFPHVANLCRVSGLLHALPFDIRYQLEVCISRGALSEYAIDAAFLLKLESMNRSESRRILERVADEGKRVTDPMTIFGKTGAASFEISPPPSLRSLSYCVVMRKVMVTPTTLYLTSPTLEVANRVLRRFQHLQDRFIRVQFTGELYEGRIRPARTARGTTTSTSGSTEFSFGDPRWRAALRVSSFWKLPDSGKRRVLLFPTNQISCDDIRNSMGKFSHIRTVAKFAARMGQCFSSTREIRTISVPKIRPIEDVENAAGYCFTDGVGKISAFLAAMIVQELDLDFAHMAPSAYQFRMGGCKGVLAVWPDAKKREVHVRRSQAKFESEYNGLEIIRYPDLLDLLSVHVEKHNSAQIYSRDAISLLRQQVDENQTTLTLAEIVLHGFREPAVKEPFISTVLNLWREPQRKICRHSGAEALARRGGFPAKGDRDLPSMLSGGDLDGDDFFVIWEPTLIPPEWNHPPMDYQPPKPKEIDTDVQVCHLQKFFVSYMKNDILPTVALAHLAHADNLHDGAKNPKCITLAKLHSKAVDYVKSGEPAEMDKSLIPRRWPHFMEKRVPRDMIYRSKRALGAIYDTICDVAFIPSYTHNFDKRILDKAPQDAELLEKARQIKAQYDVSMRRILSQREIATEFEVWSGFVLSKPRVGSAYKVQEEIGRQFGSVRQKFRELCYEAAGSSSGDGLKAFVAAIYKVTSDEAKAALEGPGDPTRHTMADASRRKGVDWIPGGSSRASEFAEDNEDSEDNRDDKEKGDSEDNNATSRDGTGDANPLPMQPPVTEFAQMRNRRKAQTANSRARSMLPRQRREIIYPWLREYSSISHTSPTKMRL